MGIMVYSLLWVMQDFVHQPYCKALSLTVEDAAAQPGASLRQPKP